MNLFLNSYYHSFSIGFNWYYIVAPVLALLIGVIGYHGHLFDRKRRKHMYFKQWVIPAVSIVFTIIVMLLVAMESSHGIVQVFDNSLGEFESPGTSPVKAFLIFFIAGFLYWAAFTPIGSVALKIRRDRNKKH